MSVPFRNMRKIQKIKQETAGIWLTLSTQTKKREQRGKPIEVGRARFETRFTILDAPVISARKGEFETGYEKGGQTREHVQLAKTLGISKLLVNKMDDPTVNWSKKDVQFLPISGLVGSNMKTRVDRFAHGVVVLAFLKLSILLEFLSVILKAHSECLL